VRFKRPILILWVGQCVSQACSAESLFKNVREGLRFVAGKPWVAHAASQFVLMAFRESGQKPAPDRQGPWTVDFCREPGTGAARPTVCVRWYAVSICRCSGHSPLWHDPDQRLCRQNGT
jgi:hypothetical protein